MKKKFIIMLSIVAIGLIVYISTGFNTPPSAATIADDYVVLAWNDLGMHCANADFSEVVILPPYNNFNAQVIKRGNASLGVKPEVVSSGLDVKYSIPGNTYSVGKTNFWDYEDKLFGVNLPDNIGLGGKGLSGTMDVPAGENFYHVEGVPITPFTDDDLVNEDPYQLALVEVMMNGTKIAETKNVMPVSNEINCLSSGCHSSTKDILSRHSDSENWPKPVLCASCHSSPALAAPGKPGVMSLSEAMHTKHKDKTSDCYKCHPGPNTECLRGVMSNEHNMNCTDCHGGMKQVSESLHNGRRPWIDEPKCGSCHGSNYAEETGQLYRNSKGHGGLFCTTCHGSPHAIVPSREENDNLQNYNLQGYAGTLSDCKVCHTTNPTGAGPHGIYAQTEAVDADNDGYDSSVDCDDSNPDINPGAFEIPDNCTDENCDGVIEYSTPYHLSCLPLSVYPNPFSTSITINYNDNFSYKLYRGSSLVLQSSASYSDSYTISIPGNLDDGSYILTVINDNSGETTSVNLVKKSTRRSRRRH